jgi:hypothetical protein
MRRDIDRQLAGLRREMSDTGEKVTADVAEMKFQFDWQLPASIPQIRN